MIKSFYSLRIVKNIAHSRVNIVLSASGDRWDADMFKKLADVMNRHKIIKLCLPLGEASFRIMHFPLYDLKTLLTDLSNIGFSIECPVVSKNK